MNKTLFLTIFTICSLIFSGCSTQTDQEKFMEHIEKFENSQEFKAVYKMKLDIFGGFIDLGDLNIGFFKKEKNEKAVIEVNSGLFDFKFDSYIKGDKIITCTDSDMGLFGESVSMNEESCEIDDADEALTFIQLNKMINFSEIDFTKDVLVLNNTKEFIGRTCESFLIESESISLNFMDEINILESNEEEKESSKKVRAEFCFDKKTSVLLYVKIEGSSYSELLDKFEFNEIFSIEIVDFNDKVNDDVFKLPKSLVVENNACIIGETVAVITPFQNKNENVIVNIFEEINYFDEKQNDKIEKTLEIEQVSFTEFEPKVLTINHKLNRSSVDYEICVNGECVKSSCYDYNYFNDGEESIAYTCLKLTGNENTCEENSLCMYNDGICEEFSCHNADDKNTCEGNSLCTWESYSLFDEEQSEDSGYCSEISCYSFEDENSCTSNSLGCFWNEDYESCSVAMCLDFEDKNSCVSSDLGCEWDEQFSYCSTNYNY